MTATSAGVVCTNGSLAFCRDGKMESLLTLDQLPVSITLCVTMAGDHGVIFSYLLSLPGWSRCLLGKVVLPNPGFKAKVFPVFTVSQRVKLQFPTSSSVWGVCFGGKELHNQSADREMEKSLSFMLSYTWQLTALYPHFAESQVQWYRGSPGDRPPLV